MQIKEMSVGDVFKRGIKKVILECASVKFWAAIGVGYANWHIISIKHEFDMFGMASLLGLLGIREIADYAQQKKTNGGEVK
jgi:hypothetical protein